MTTPAKVPQQQAAAALLRQYEPVVAKLLERTDTSPATFLAQVANACRAVPTLWECDPATLLGAALRSAQLNLSPNDGNNLCWIIPRKKGGVNEATWQLGYGGILELARRAEPGLRFEGRAVYPNDTFKVDFAGGWSHVPYHSRRPRKGDRGGDPVLWYVVARHPDGTEQIEVVDRAEVERHRSYSQQPDGQLWTKSYDAAALKSAVVNLKRWLPHTPQLALALAADGTAVDVRDMEDEGDPPAVERGEPFAIEQPEPAP
jgi:recombination protein RecT